MSKILISGLFVMVMLFSCKKDVSKNKTEKEDLQVELKKKMSLNSSDLIGSVDSVAVFEGGFSGLFPGPIVDGKQTYYTVSDRGPNIKIKSNTTGVYKKIFPFPDYNPKIFQLVEGDEGLKILNKKAIKNKQGIAYTGLPNKSIHKQKQEQAYQTYQGDSLKFSENGLDVEAIVVNKNGNFVITDEYKTAILEVSSKNYQVTKLFSPSEKDSTNQSIPEVFGFRKPNRGFESLAITPNNQLWSILQSPAWYTSEENTKNSRLTRALRINPAQDNFSETYFFEIPEVKNIKTSDWKIGDWFAVSETEFVAILHATSKKAKQLQVVLISFKDASAIQANDDFPYEELIDSEMLFQDKNIQSAKSIVLFDLLEMGFDEENQKPEGIAMLDDKTIVIINDNDYDINFDEEKQRYYSEGIKTNIYQFGLSKPIQEIIAEMK